MVSFELCKEMFFCLVTIVRQRKTKLEHQSMESKALRFDSSWGLRIFSCLTLAIRRNNISLYFFTKLKNYRLSFSKFNLFLPFVSKLPFGCIECFSHQADHGEMTRRTRLTKQILAFSLRDKVTAIQT